MWKIVRGTQYYLKKTRSEATVKASERNECILTERCFKRYYNRNALAMIQTVDFPCLKCQRWISRRRNRFRYYNVIYCRNRERLAQYRQD